MMHQASCIMPTFGGRRPSMEDNLQWKTTFGGRQTSVEEVGEKQPLVEDDLW